MHLERLRHALDGSDLPTALGAAFDAQLDADVSAGRFGATPDAAASAFAEVLARAGLHELLAAHDELTASSLDPEERARAYLSLGKLYEETLSSPDRALRAFREALRLSPGIEEARNALLEHRRGSLDPWAVADALIYAALHHPGKREALTLLRDLAHMAEVELEAPRLAHWAVERQREVQPSAELDAQAERLRPQAEALETALQEAEQQLKEASDSQCGAAVERVAEMLVEWPERQDDLEGLQRQLVSADPDRTERRLRFEKSLERSGNDDELETLLRRWLAQPPAGFDVERARVRIARIRSQHGDLPGALEILDASLDEPAAHAQAWSYAVVLAARRDDPVRRARALSRLSQPLSASVRAVALAVSAEALLEAGDLDGASSASDQARRADPSLARPVGVLAAVALRRGPSEESAEAIDRAMGVIVPRPALCEALAEAHEALGDPGAGVGVDAALAGSATRRCSCRAHVARSGHGKRRCAAVG